MITYLAVDLGGTNVTLGLVTADGRLLQRQRFPVRAERGPEPIIADLISGLRAIKDKVEPNHQPAGVAVGAAGLIRPREGLLVFAPNLPGWRDVPLADHLSQALDLEVRLENDANLYALGEALVGSGRGLKNLLLITLGTGVGGGLILGGRLWGGSSGTAGEIGHMVVEPTGQVCGCGSRGCLETVASATAMTRTAREWMSAGRTCGYTGPLGNLTAAHLYDLAEKGDTLAQEIFDRAGQALGLVLTGVFNLLALEGVIIGGGAAGAYRFIFPAMYQEFSSRVFAVAPEQIRFAPAALGDDAPLFGAPALFM